MKKRTWGTAVLAVLLTLSLVLCSCSKISLSPTINSAEIYGYFDTATKISSYALDKEEEFNANVSQISSVLEHWHRLLDIYNEYEGMNNLCTVNRLAGGDPVPVDPDLIAFVQYAKEMCELTKGEMDITLGAVLKLWHDAGEAETPYVPEESALNEAAEHVGFDRLEIDAVNNTLRLTDPKASLDAGALGKGYAAERTAEMLIAKEVTSYALSVGGNIRLLGTKADGSPYVTGIRDPQNTDDLALTLEISDTSCVTSGDYERYFTVGGKRYNHIIDKDTLRPAAYFSSVTVICKDSALADALSTALFCMSFEDGLALVTSLEGVEAVWIYEDASINFTMGLESLMTLN